MLWLGLTSVASFQASLRACLFCWYCPFVLAIPDSGCETWSCHGSVLPDFSPKVQQMNQTAGSFMSVDEKGEIQVSIRMAAQYPATQERLPHPYITDTLGPSPHFFAKDGYDTSSIGNR
eukprot:6475972-Amphidinium_carterae.1